MNLEIVRKLLLAGAVVAELSRRDREGHGTERPVIDGDRSRDSQKQDPSTPHQGEAK